MDYQRLQIPPFWDQDAASGVIAGRGSFEAQEKQWSDATQAQGFGLPKSFADMIKVQRTPMLLFL